MTIETLRTYLADHLAGARYAVELIEECRDEYPDLDSFFAELLEEVEKDRRILEALLRRIGGSRSRLKEAGIWTLEKLSRIKHSEPSESTGSSLLERLEALSLGVAGKRSLWEALEATSADGRVGGLDLTELQERAQEQHDHIERRRRRAARVAFLPEGGGEPKSEASERAGESTSGESALRGVLLDVDGTLIQTNDGHARAWVDAFSEVGRTVPFEQVRALIGMGGDKLIPRLTGIDPEEEDGRIVARRHTEIFLDRYLEGCRPFSGARKLLETMRRDGLGLTVATSASEEEMERVLEAAGIEDLVEDATSASDVDDSKPEGDVVRAALSVSDWSPDEVLMLGDTPFDVRAGEDAGVDVVAVRCGGSSDVELVGAIAIYRAPAHLLEEYSSSPFARRGRTQQREPAPGSHTEPS